MYYEQELYHHGIKGQRWGVRRFQDEDGSLTSAGKKRYDKDVESARQNYDKAKQAYKKAAVDHNIKTYGGLKYDKNSAENLKTATKERRYAKEDFHDAKIAAKIKGKEKSNHQLKLEQKYRDSGMNDQEAEVAAYKRIRTEHVLAAAAGMTVAAASAYAVHKYRDLNVDKVIKAGTTIQNISPESTRGVKDAFYSSKTWMDNAKYTTMYSNELHSRNYRDVYKHEIKVNKDLKVASENNASRVLKNWLDSDKESLSNVKKRIDRNCNAVQNPAQRRILEKAKNSLGQGKVDKNVYEAFNLLLVDHSPESQETNEKFYKAMKKHGYDAIKDINDTKASGYNTHSPVVVFNGENKTSVTKSHLVDDKEVAKYTPAVLADKVGRQAVAKGVSYATSAGSAALVAHHIKSKNEQKRVQKYREEHPNTELSYKEIARMTSK